MQLAPGIADELRPISGGRSSMDPKFHIKHIGLGDLGGSIEQLFPLFDSAY
jgi:hypothetical protein